MLPEIFRSDEVSSFCAEFVENEADQLAHVAGAPPRNRDDYCKSNYKYCTPPKRVFSAWVSKYMRLYPLDVRGCACECTCAGPCRRKDNLCKIADATRHSFRHALYLTSKLFDVLRDANHPVWCPGDITLTVEVVRGRLHGAYESKRASDPSCELVRKLLPGIQARARAHRVAFERLAKLRELVRRLTKHNAPAPRLDGDVAPLIFMHLLLRDRIALRRTCKHYAQLPSLKDTIPHLRIRQSADFPHEHVNNLHYVSARDNVNLFVDFCMIHGESVGGGVDTAAAPPPSDDPLARQRWQKYCAKRKAQQGPVAVEGKRVEIVPYERYFTTPPDLHLALVDAETLEKLDGIKPSAKLFQNGLSFHLERSKNTKRANAVYVGANTKFRIAALSSRHGGRLFRLRVYAHAFRKHGGLVHVDTFSEPFRVVSERREATRLTKRAR
jgi:hypothetical protein